MINGIVLEEIIFAEVKLRVPGSGLGNFIDQKHGARICAVARWHSSGEPSVVRRNSTVLM